MRSSVACGSSRNDTPVLILSGLSRPQAKVKGLGLGADDFITKPFDKSELLARMQAITRRSKGFSQPTLRLGAIELNLDSREVTVDGQEVHLTGKEYSILELLVLRKGMVLTKEAFLNHLYGGMDEPEMKIIDVFICKLRKKLAVAGADNLIGTVWGRGYMIREPAGRCVGDHAGGSAGAADGAADGRGVGGTKAEFAASDCFRFRNGFRTRHDVDTGVRPKRLEDAAEIFSAGVSVRSQHAHETGLRHTGGCRQGVEAHRGIHDVAQLTRRGLDIAIEDVLYRLLNECRAERRVATDSFEHGFPETTCQWHSVSPPPS
jgi:DNA-binding winged helix-turn-helix (wHTH) protein